MEEPECRVSGIIQALLSALRKHVGYETRRLPSKGAQIHRLGVAPGARVTFEADHVSRPQSLNQCSGDDGAHLVARWPGPYLMRPRRRDDALISSQESSRAISVWARGMAAAIRRRAACAWRPAFFRSADWSPRERGGISVALSADERVATRTRPAPARCRSPGPDRHRRRARPGCNQCSSRGGRIRYARPRGWDEVPPSSPATTGLTIWGRIP